MVADDIILSAAHCYEAFDDVDLGRHNIKDPDDDFERYNVETFVTHPNYVEQGKRGVAYDNDFMIIKVYGWSKKNVVKSNDNSSKTNNGQDLSVMGWGVADNINKLPAEILKHVTVNTLCNGECRNRSDPFPLWEE